MDESHEDITLHQDKTKKSSDSSDLSFESQLNEIRDIVDQLENTADIPLEQSLAMYERGTTLCRSAQALLENCLQSVELLDEDAASPQQ